MPAAWKFLVTGYTSGAPASSAPSPVYEPRPTPWWREQVVQPLPHAEDALVAAIDIAEPVHAFLPVGIGPQSGGSTAQPLRAGFLSTRYGLALNTRDFGQGYALYDEDDLEAVTWTIALRRRRNRTNR